MFFFPCFFYSQSKYVKKIREVVTRLSSGHEVMLRILNGQKVEDAEKRKISCRLRTYKMNIRSDYDCDLSEYIEEVDDFLFFLLNDETHLPSWFLRQTKFPDLRLGMVNLIIEALTGYYSCIRLEGME